MPAKRKQLPAVFAGDEETVSLVDGSEQEFDNSELLLKDIVNVEVEAAGFGELALVEGAHDTQRFAATVADACKLRKRSATVSLGDVVPDSEASTLKRKRKNTRAAETAQSDGCEPANVFELDLHAMPAPYGYLPRGGKVVTPRAAGPKFVKPTMPTGDLASLKASLGIDTLTSKLVELVGVVSGIATQNTRTVHVEHPVEQFPEFDEHEVGEFDFHDFPITVSHDAEPEVVDVSDFGEVPFAVGDMAADLPKDDLFEDDKTGAAVAETLAAFVNKISTQKSNVTKLMEKHPRPENCQFVGAPRLNQEVWVAIPFAARTRDVHLQEIQKSLAAGMVPLLRLVEMLSDPFAFRLQEAKESVNDAIILLGHSLSDISLKRKYFLKPHLAKHLITLCAADNKVTNPVTKLLFGDDLGEKAKSLAKMAKNSLGAQSYSTYRGRSNFRGRFSGGRSRFFRGGHAGGTGYYSRGAYGGYSGGFAGRGNARGYRGNRGGNRGGGRGSQPTQ
jgi:hypothetical protein